MEKTQSWSEEENKAGLQRKRRHYFFGKPSPGTGEGKFWEELQRGGAFMNTSPARCSQADLQSRDVFYAAAFGEAPGKLETKR